MHCLFENCEIFPVLDVAPLYEKSIRFNFAFTNKNQFAFAEIIFFSVI